MAPELEPVGSGKSASAPTKRHRGDRARPLPPEDRRRAIVTAVIPCIVEHGINVSTRDLAEAAEVSEGTLFRVFPDKISLVAAALLQAAKEYFSPDPLERAQLEAQLETLKDSSLEEKLLTLVEATRHRAAEGHRIFTLLHEIPPEDLPAEFTEHISRQHKGSSPSEIFQPDRHQFLTKVEEYLGDSADRLTLSTADLMEVIRALSIVDSAGFPSGSVTFSAAEITDILLHGIVNDSPDG